MASRTIDGNRKFALQVAKALGDWELKQEPFFYSFLLIQPSTGKTLSFMSRNDDESWSISVGLPKDAKNQQPFYDDKKFIRPSIGVGNKKSPEQVAKDVIRRIFPDYELIWNELSRRVEGANASYNRHSNMKLEVEKRTGVKFKSLYNDEKNTHDNLYFDVDETKYNFELTVSNGRIKLECDFSDDPELAFEVVELIRKRLSEKTTPA